jgi:actin-related protein
MKMVDVLKLHGEQEEEDPAIVLDLGSFTVKSGFSGDDTPKIVIPTLFGVPRDPGQMIGMDQKDCYTGGEVRAKKHLLRVSEPIKNGIIQDFD